MTDEKQIRNEIKQDFEKRKKEYEQVEEMAKVIINASCYGSECEKCNYISTVEEAETCCVCLKALYNAGYRKLPENAVVIPEKIDKKTSPEDMIKIAKYNETIRKKTAREILKALKAKQVICSPEEDNFVYMLDINEIAKQYGVEV